VKRAGDSNSCRSGYCGSNSSSSSNTRRCGVQPAAKSIKSCCLCAHSLQLSLKLPPPPPLLLLLLLLLQAAEELLSGVPDDVAVWGWKEPQAIYALPFLYRVSICYNTKFTYGGTAAAAAAALCIRHSL
jgi:hypothetical protein